MLHILIQVLEDYLAHTENASYTHTCIRRLSITNREWHIDLYTYKKIIQHKQRMLHRLIQVLEDYLAHTVNTAYTHTGIRRLSSTNRDRMLLILIQVLEDFLAQTVNAT